MSEAEAIYSDPDYHAAVVAQVSEDHPKMLKHSQALVKRYPDSARAHFVLGCAYGKLGFTADEIAAYQQAIKIKPDFAEAWDNLGVAYGEEGRTADAIAAYQQAIKIKPDDAPAWILLVAAYASDEQRDKAWEALRTLERLAPAKAAELRRLLSEP